ncbi:[acyl-carrier-protein] S-malonyltransferase [Kitasatospora sp. MAA4]|uniref:ACP S-malonyltransferase n=1 Tax=Kitasatospora sp. MAA4 TaxID=3035093 RepID=UPI002476EAA7|nr:ACP S-malonyltransferase [Kitasatospora sp. MAA4]MDH6135319.1 [acyl-carrier-protein] S-malonyltransferase [Kitasatospora sp. MAA4]
MSTGKKIRALFPGQGSQTPGMGKALALAHPVAAACFDEASEALGLDLRELCWDAPPARLAETQNAQPALLTAAVATWRVLEERGVELTATAGHSVGAVAALVAANSLSFHQAIKLIRLRGELMASAPGEGGMCAVVATGADRMEALVAVERFGLDVAADNSPRQFVAAGDLATVRAFAAELGARAKLLDVSHAFHSRLMAPVADRWAEAVRAAEITDATVPVGLVATGSFSTAADDLAKDLTAALCAPVRWQDLMTELGSENGAPLVALGPAQALVGLAKHFPDKPALTLVNTPVSLEAFVRRLEAEDK